MQVNLQPLAKTEEALSSYLDINFRRLADALESLANTDQGVNSVTGALQITTDIAKVHNVFASLNSVPASNGCFVRAFPVGSSAPKDFILEVYDNAFAQSTVVKDVAWLVIGE